ncbi:3'-5' exoribonuclease HELZ2-like isoform X1 [Littorina saxatilis]
MGLYGSKPENNLTMEEGRESPPSADEQQTSEDGSDSASVRQSDTPESSENFGDAQRAVEIFEGDPHEDFLEAIEPFFTRAERAISHERFDFSAAKDLVLVLRDLGQRYEAKGCTEASLEETVMTRALKTVFDLMDGVNLSQAEVYDPRQTMVYLYCAMAVFPRTLRLERNAQGILLYHFSPKGSVCPRQLEELNRFCALKTECEGTKGWPNLLQHKRLLADLAAWLEVDMTPIAHMISSKSMTILSILVGETRKMSALPGMSTVSDRMERLLEMNVVVAASSFVRKGFLREAKDYRRILMRVDTSRLPPFLATRYAYVNARLLNNCREFAKALNIARDAITAVTDPEERREFEQLINEINDALETVSQGRHNQGPADPQWLEGTYALTNQNGRAAQEAARQSYLAQARRRRVRTVSVSRRGQTPSPAPLSRQSGGAAQGTFRGGRSRSSSLSYSPNTSHSLYSSSPASVSTYSAGDHSEGASVAPASFSSRENLLDSDWDDSDDQEEEVYDPDREVRFVDGYDPDADSTAETEAGDFEETSMVETLTAGDEDGQDWFEKSEEALQSREEEEGGEEEASIELSERQKGNFNKGDRGNVFYPTLLRNAEAEQLLWSDRTKYVRCQIKIERAHKSIARVLDSRCKHSEILIVGRSRANQTYMDDEVVVEITAEPGTNRSQQQVNGVRQAGADNSVEKLPHGKVVGLLNRVNYSDVDHPVLFCTLDEMEGHLMKPLCKTVPKIHVLNDLVRRKYLALKKNRIELKKISPEGEVIHTGFLNVEQDKREQYVFKVAILAWRPQTIYPLGAVLSAHIGGRDYAGGLQVLSMQQRVPKRYPRAAVESTKVLLQQTLSKKGRQDLTELRLFTIDPPGSKDIDDAISIQKKGTHYVIGVHIADVAAQVAKDSGVDQEARKRAVTFYPLNRRPHAMLPEPLSHGKCSLLQDQERLALSVFFTFNEKGKQVQEPSIQKTVIRSCRQLTYEEAQKVIKAEENVNVDSMVQEDIRQLHKITSQLKEMRQKHSMLFVPFEDPRLHDLERLNEHTEAHSLIEELMILANATVASYLTKRPRYRDVMLVRTHTAPSWEELAQWREAEGSVTDLVMQLQGKKVTPTGTQLSLSTSVPTESAARKQKNVVLQKEVWHKLCQCLEEGELTEARRLVYMDALHPLQCLAASRWMNLMETAQYGCCLGLNRPDLRHFGLDLDVYTHFTSPIRRYADVYVQRLLHAALSGAAPDSTPDDVTALCCVINSATSRQKAFGKGCMSLKVSESLQRQPLLFRAYVDKVDEEQLTVCVPSLLKVSDRKQDLPFSILGVSSQPELVTDTITKIDSVTVQWNKRIYEKNGLCPGSLRPIWEHLDRSAEREQAALQNLPSEARKQKKMQPLIMYISPDQLSKSVRHADWIHILQNLTSGRDQAWNAAPQALDRVPRPANGPAGRDHVEAEYMSCEKGDRTVSVRPVKFKRVYTQGQVVQVQMSAQPKSGLLKPRVEVLHTAHNASVCTQHVSEPVPVLTSFATRATRDQNFTTYLEYARAWMPLLEMEAAVEAGNNDGGVVIENVPVSLKIQTLSNNLRYRGSFELDAKFCFDRCIDFGGKSSDTIEEEEFKSDNSYPLDYLCLRYKMKCSDAVISRVRNSEVPEAVDTHFTWLAHASVVRVNHLDKKSESGGKLVITFVLTNSSPQPPPQLMAKAGDKVTIEVLPKSEVDRRCQMALLLLEDETRELARAIAFGRSIPKLESDHKKLALRLGMRPEKYDVLVNDETARHLPRNNPDQESAIKMALTHSLALVQGPPGTGKTNTGIKLVYLFSKINRQLEAEGKGKKTVLYCGPSNKSVDLVARELRSKLGSKCPKIVRMYGSAIERKDYPVPTGDLRSSKNLRDLNSDPSLQDISLHHLIRMDDRKHAEEIIRFDSHFQKCILYPRKFKATSNDLKNYRKLVNKASLLELGKYEVVLTTTSVGGNHKLIKGTNKSIYQVMIDECAMSTEPQSMVPITATKAKQVVLIGDHKQLRPIIKCQPASELGLDRSLFERLFTRFPSYTVFLGTQYRMHPQICAFPSKEFYENKLETGRSILWTGTPLSFWPRHPISNLADKVTPHILVDVRGVEETLSVTTEDGNERSKSNALEAEKVVEILTFLKQQHKVETGCVKILTQYNAQRSMLEKKLRDLCMDRSQNVFDRYDVNKLQISTVVSSQGGEWDYVILSTVRSIPSYMIEPNPTHGWCRQNLGFITDRNQVNVALTRARRGLFIVGNVELLRCDEVWSHLVKRYELLNCAFSDPSLFPPPPPARPRNRRHHSQHTGAATNSWQRA